MKNKAKYIFMEQEKIVPNFKGKQYVCFFMFEKAIFSKVENIISLQFIGIGD